MTTKTWIPTEEQHVYQLGEGRDARYKVMVGDQEIQCGEGDQAYLSAITTRDMEIRSRSGRGVVTEAPKILTPPEPGDSVLISRAKLVSIVEDSTAAVVEINGTEIEVEYDSLTKDV